MLEFLVTGVASLLAGDWLMLLLSRFGPARAARPVADRAVNIAPPLARRILKRLKAQRDAVAADDKQRQRLDEEIERLAAATNT